MAFFSSLAAAIDSYTGLSPAAFFTIVALMVGAYRLVSAFFVYPDEESAAKRSLAPQMPPPPEAFSPPPQPVQLGDITLEDLKAYDGSDPNKPLLVAIKGQVYDVSIGRLFYGPGGPYAFFAGRETSRALALMSFDPRDLNSDLSDLSEAELEVLHDWEEKFKEKYVKVGNVVAGNSKDEDESSKEIKKDED
ncbi:probable steroid-binding protein 3 isoform X1 [Zingiber officinale]|uniref:probable steroid-binding protein 3 isoform X1 n=1 Tax=Zingiber officinale TaxID=94328 RepID=UPI001C4AA35E|nr:probable steroid-binding protein 3 isoform X1 [Zingiber officinale]